MKNIFLIVISALFVFSSYAQTISKSQAIADIDYYNQALKDVHYNPFLYISEKAYDEQVNRIKNELKDSVDIKFFTLILSSLTSSLNDGHTMPVIVQPVFKNDFRRKIYFPLELVADTDYKVYLPSQSNQYNIPTGAEITSINQIDLQNFYKNVTSFIGGLPAFRKEMAVKLLGNYLYLSGVTAPFQVQYKYQGKKQTTIIQEGTILKTCLAMAFPQFNGESYSFKIIGKKVAYINLVTMEDDYKKYEAFFDSCFVVAKNHKIGTVTIDLRKNTGGNSIIADLLISYFNNKAYSLSGGRYWRVSQRYKDYLTAKGNKTSLYFKEPNNTLLDQRKCGPHDPMFINNKNLFTGKVYLITGPMTFSSANQLADAVKQYKIATIIGEPTGENTNDFGETYKFDLPNSKIAMQVTTTFDLGVECNPKSNHPVMPDILIKPTMVEKINHNDPAINYILKAVK